MTKEELGNLKKKLAQTYKYDREDYTDSKTDYINTNCKIEILGE